MAEECLLSMPEAYDLDYTMKEYMSYVDYVKKCVERLNSQSPGDSKYTPHTVELAVWTHYILYDLKPELLEDMPEFKTELEKSGNNKIEESNEESVEDIHEIKTEPEKSGDNKVGESNEESEEPAAKKLKTFKENITPNVKEAVEETEKGHHT